MALWRIEQPPPLHMTHSDGLSNPLLPEASYYVWTFPNVSIFNGSKLNLCLSTFDIKIRQLGFKTLFANSNWTCFITVSQNKLKAEKSNSTHSRPVTSNTVTGCKTKINKHLLTAKLIIKDENLYLNNFV